MLQEHNTQIDRQNAAIDEPNAMMPEGQVPLEKKPQLNLSEYLLMRLGQVGDDGYSQIKRRQEDAFKSAFYSLPAEQQEAMMRQLSIPDAIQTRDESRIPTP